MSVYRRMGDVNCTYARSPKPECGRGVAPLVDELMDMRMAMS